MTEYERTLLEQTRAALNTALYYAMTFAALYPVLVHGDDREALHGCRAAEHEAYRWLVQQAQNRDSTHE